MNDKKVLIQESYKFIQTCDEYKKMYDKKVEDQKDFQNKMDDWFDEIRKNIQERAEIYPMGECLNSELGDYGSKHGE